MPTKSEPIIITTEEAEEIVKAVIRGLERMIHELRKKRDALVAENAKLRAEIKELTK